MKRILLFAMLMLFLAYGTTQAQTTPVPIIDLPDLAPGYSMSGTLAKQGDQITLGFDVPANVDLVIRLTTDKSTLPYTCVELNGTPICPSTKDDGPISYSDLPQDSTLFTPSSDSPQKVYFTIQRLQEGAVSYQIQTLGLQTQGIGLDETRTIDDTSVAMPYTSYRLRVDPMQPFVLEAEDQSPQGAFVWLNHSPEINSSFKPTADRLPFKRWVDDGSNSTTSTGVTRIELYYLGGNEFWVLMTSTGPFVLHSSSVQIQPLDAGVALTQTMSYRNPVVVARLNANAGEMTNVNFQITPEGMAGAWVYEAGDIAGLRLLGNVNIDGPQFPFADMIPVQMNDVPLYAYVRLASTTRVSFETSIEWERGTASN